MKRTISILLLAAGLVSGSMQASIPAEVVDVLKKSDAAMTHPDGVGLEIQANVKALFITMDMNIQTFTKGEKSLMKMTTSIMGESAMALEGCDGVRAWEYSAATGEQDTLIIYSKPKEADSEYSPDFDLYEEYEDAKIKLKNGTYEIVFTKPKKPDTPKKTTMIIDATTYQALSMITKEGVATVNAEFRNLQLGNIDDSIFVFDRSAYPKAVVIEK